MRFGVDANVFKRRTAMIAELAVKKYRVRNIKPFHAKGHLLGDAFDAEIVRMVHVRMEGPYVRELAHQVAGNEKVVLSSHLFWTSDYTFRYNLWTHHQPGSHRRKATQEFIYLFLFLLLSHLPSAVLALIFCREKDSAVPFPRRP